MNEGIPGRLVSACGLHPLKRISPSRFMGIKSALCEKCGEPQHAHRCCLGHQGHGLERIIHEILQMIPTGRFNSKSKPKSEKRGTSKSQKPRNRCF